MGNLYQGSVALGASGGGGVGSLTELGVVATATELNYMDGVTSNVQNQLDDKIGLSDLGDIAYVDNDEYVGSSTPLNADTLCGKDLSYFAQKSDIKPKAGFIYPLATPNIPDGFLLCDGKAYSRTEYAELFAAIGTYYGEGDGSTTFNMPNLQTRVPVGAGNGYELGSIGGEATHTLTVNEMPNHTHDVRVKWHDNAASVNTAHANGVVVNVTNDVIGHLAVDRSGGTGTYGTGGNQPHNNMQPYTVINYIISTGKDNSVYIRDVINGAQVMPLEVQYGGTGALNADDARKNLGIREYKQNLLDNSDFRNPVNQRGQSDYSFDSGYTIDRWKLHWTGDGSLCINDGYISLGRIEHSAYLFQNIPMEMGIMGKIVTVAAKVRGGGGVGFCFNDGTIRESTSFDSDEWQIVTKTITVPYYSYSNTALNGIELSTHLDSTIDVEWAALYEGEYTTETLPYYVPKGYGAELVECKRYYRQSNGFDGRLIVDNVWSGAGERFEIPMRAVPTVSIYSVNNVKSAVTTWGLSDNVPANETQVTQNGFDIWSDQKFTTGRRYFYRYTASADL